MALRNTGRKLGLILSLLLNVLFWSSFWEKETQSTQPPQDLSVDSFVSHEKPGKALGCGLFEPENEMQPTTPTMESTTSSPRLILGKTLADTLREDLEFVTADATKLRLKVENVSASSKDDDFQRSGTFHQRAGNFVNTRWKGHSHASLSIAGMGELEMRSTSIATPMALSSLKSILCENTEAEALSTPSLVHELSTINSVEANAAITLDCPRAGNAFIDVIAFYNDQARVRGGGALNDPSDNGAIEAKILSAVTVTNLAYQNSSIPLALRLTYIGPIDYAYPLTESYSRALSEARSTTDGIIDEIHISREAYNADAISLWLDNDTSGGLGYVLTPTSTSEAAIHTVNPGNSVYTFAHELGHNQGCRHQRASYTTIPAGWHTYSYGYSFTGTDSQNYATIMVPVGSLSGLNVTRIPYFSSSLVSYQGTKTGVANSEDCARSMSESRFCLESFYTAQLPDAKLSLIDTPPQVQVELEKGYVGQSYRLQRSTTPSNWLDTDSILTTDSQGSASATQARSTSTHQFYRWVSH